MSILPRPKLVRESAGPAGSARPSAKQAQPTVAPARRWRRWPNRIMAAAEYVIVYTLGAIFGISWVVRYLRNPNPDITPRLLRAFGAAIGNNTTIKRSLILDNVCGDQNSTGDFSHLKIAENCYIGDYVFLDLANEIIIEDDAVVSGRACFITHAECKRSSYLREKFPRKCEPIVVETGAWVGFGATILAGVTVGANSVVGASALLLDDADPYSIYVGAPARLLKRIK